MKLVINNKSFHYEIEKLCRIFFPNEKIKVVYFNDEKFDDIIVSVNENIIKDKKELSVIVSYYGEIKKSNIIISEDTFDDTIRLLAEMIFKILCELTGVIPKWGVLTGIRPIKLIRRIVGEYKDEFKAEKYFKEKLLVSNEKTKLALNIMHKEQQILDLSKKQSFSLYVSIPFCPSRCSYCSFVSHSIDKAHKLIPEYLSLLLKEIEKTAEIAHKLKLKLETVYIGGGTPTTLNAEDLGNLICKIKECFDINSCREFTVEAGRPDTITKEKLLSIKENIDKKILRISINPQTFNDEVLNEIGRKHTAKQSIETFELARNLGFKNINMDMIIGLPKDSYNSFKKSINKLCNLSPEGITIHTLSMKRSSNLTAQHKKLYAFECELASEMWNYAYLKLYNNGYLPYYLYRQSKMLGNLENTGFSKLNYEGLYNVYVMDETHTILACGAGAVTKLKSQLTGKIERIYNYKHPYEYIYDFDKLIERKKGVIKFYDECF